MNVFGEKFGHYLLQNQMLGWLVVIKLNIANTLKKHLSKMSITMPKMFITVVQWKYIS